MSLSWTMFGFVSTSQTCKASRSYEKGDQIVCSKTCLNHMCLSSRMTDLLFTENSKPQEADSQLFYACTSFRVAGRFVESICGKHKTRHTYHLVAS